MPRYPRPFGRVCGPLLSAESASPHNLAGHPLDAFRAGSIRNMLEFPSLFLGARRITLEQNIYQ